jgi:hypothetical protein
MNLNFMQRGFAALEIGYLLWRLLGLSDKTLGVMMVNRDHGHVLLEGATVSTDYGLPIELMLLLEQLLQHEVFILDSASF